MRNIILLLCLIGGIISAKAQQVISSSGAAEYTIGETVIFTSADGKVTQGFHQPVLVVTAINENKLFDVTVYPNPASAFIKVVWSRQDVIIRLYRISGELVLEQKLSGTDETLLDIAHYAPGVYLLNVTGVEGSGIFRILKQ